ncbi:MAG: threonine/homoserine/homoserine lactone efflux protein [Oceanicoccus sp.]
MGNLLTILLILFVVLAVVVMLTERYAKPIDAEQQSKLSRVIIILIFVMLSARLIQFLVEN